MLSAIVDSKQDLLWVFEKKLKNRSPFLVKKNLQKVGVIKKNGSNNEFGAETALRTTSCLYQNSRSRCIV